MARYVPFILLWLAWFSLGTCGAKTQKKDLDMSTGLTEKDWFVASEHLAELDAYCEQWEGLRSLHIFDFFSHSRRVSCSFERKGFRARSYDIRSSPSEDILSRAGFYLALHCVLQSYSCRTRPAFNSSCISLRFSMILFVFFLGCWGDVEGARRISSDFPTVWFSNVCHRLCDHALLMAAPPCCLFVSISASAHRRTAAWPQVPQEKIPMFHGFPS